MYDVFSGKAKGSGESRVFCLSNDRGSCVNIKSHFENKKSHYKNKKSHILRQKCIFLSKKLAYVKFF